MSPLIRKSRKNHEIRPVRVTRDFCPRSDGSVLFELGKTRVICAASITQDVPDHAVLRSTGWITAEYSLLPYSTRPRTERRLIRPDGRSVEIQRLIGRSLRNIVNLSAIRDYAVVVDCDVIEADGGTRTASITGAFIALRMALQNLLRNGLITEDPIISNVAAISVGYVNGALLLDLDYEEDSRASIDMNIVMDSQFHLIEVQGTGEETTFSIEQLNDMIELARGGIEKLFDIQNGF
jgi:ribonuclease PH